MAVDFEQIKQLVPERRVKELQRLIEKLKKDIEDKQDYIKESERLLALADEEARILEQMQIPETKPAPKKTAKIEERITELTELTEEKEEKRITREEQIELEKLLATAPPRSPEVLKEVARIPVEELYGELHRIYNRQKETGVETREDRELVYAIRKGFEIKREEGYKPAEKKKHMMTAAEQMAQDMYESTSTTYKNT